MKNVGNSNGTKFSEEENLEDPIKNTVELSAFTESHNPTRDADSAQVLGAAFLPKGPLDRSEAMRFQESYQRLADNTLDTFGNNGH